MKTITTLLSLTFFLLLTGCASIAGNNSRAVKVASYPAGAGIYVDNKQYGVTPAVINLPTYIYGGKAVTLKKPGYHDQTQMVNTQFQPIALLDILFWPSLVVDAVAGTLVKIDPATTEFNSQLLKA